MNDTYPNPWNFSNLDKNLHSPNGQLKAEYGALNEIAMGGPLTGEIFLILDGHRINLNIRCGGPVVWNKMSDKVALPIWTTSRKNKIAVVDIKDLTLIIYKKEFRVLLLDRFYENHIRGIDSPTHMSTVFDFNLNKEVIESIINFPHDRT